MKRNPAVKLILLLISIGVSTCVSSQIVSKGFVDESVKVRATDTFSLKPLEVTSYNFFEKAELGYILEKKLLLALSSNPRIRQEERATYSIEPELVVKTYEEKYTRRNYYLLNVRVTHGERTVCHFSYEYNGSSSIFDGKIQNAMIDRFVKDLVDFIKS